MVRTTFSGRELVSAFTDVGFVPVSRLGDHVRLRYEDPDAGVVRHADVPMGEEVTIGTLRSIAEQCGAEDVEAWCRWVDEQS